jgi:hypothetical protein
MKDGLTSGEVINWEPLVEKKPNKAMQRTRLRLAADG